MGDIKISFTILFLGLIFFHGLIYLGWTDKQFWTKIDYFWVSLSFLGVIGINQDVRRQFTDRQIADNKSLIKWQFEAVLHNSEQNAILYDPKTTDFKYNLFDNKNQVNAYISTANWYKNLSDSLKKHKIEIIEQDNYESIKSIKTYLDNFPFSKKKFQELAGLKDIVGYYITEIKKESDIINEIRKDENNSSEWETLLKFFSPWVLALAISLRLSKVTAQLKGIA